MFIVFIENLQHTIKTVVVSTVTKSSNIQKAEV